MKNKKGKTNLKILLATDGSTHSKVVLEKISNRAYPPKTEMRVVSVYENIPMITTLEPMGVSQEYYISTDKYAIKTAEKITKNAADILHKKNPELAITTTVINGSPKRVILEEAEKFGADLIRMIRGCRRKTTHSPMAKGTPRMTAGARAATRLCTV